jgi:hypothetical protein
MLMFPAQDIAQYIKKEVRRLAHLMQQRPLTPTQFDSRKGATWHCIVGRNFGSFVTHGSLMVSH